MERSIVVVFLCLCVLDMLCMPRRLDSLVLFLSQPFLSCCSSLPERIVRIVSHTSISIGSFIVYHVYLFLLPTPHFMVFFFFGGCVFTSSFVTRSWSFLIIIIVIDTNCSKKLWQTVTVKTSNYHSTTETSLFFLDTYIQSGAVAN